jgi:hypothetical protein
MDVGKDLIGKFTAQIDTQRVKHPSFLMAESHLGWTWASRTSQIPRYK